MNKLSFLIWFIAAMTFISSPTLADTEKDRKCLEYRSPDNSLTGVLEEKEHHSIADRGPISMRGKPYKYWILNLKDPICLNASPVNKGDADVEENDIREVQIFSFYGSDSTREYESYLNKEVAVIGELFHATSSYQRMPVQIRVIRMRLTEIENDCLEYRPAVVTLTGIIDEKVFQGTLDYRPDNEPYKYWVLNLKETVCMNASPIEPFDIGEKNVSTIQVGSDHIPDFYEKLKSDISKKVVITGELFHAFNAHQREKVLIDVKQIKLVESD